MKRFIEGYKYIAKGMVADYFTRLMESCHDLFIALRDFFGYFLFIIIAILMLIFYPLIYPFIVKFSAYISKKMEEDIERQKKENLEKRINK